MLGDAMSIFARRQHSPSLYFPSRMSWKRARFSSDGVSRHGLGMPGSVGMPRCFFHSSCERKQT